jgi:hypothetical protein
MTERFPHRLRMVLCWLGLIKTEPQREGSLSDYR